MSGTVSTPFSGGWLPRLCRGRPHQVILLDESEEPYLLRWYLLPHNRWLNIYLHRFLRSDDPRGLHDHPWWFASLILAGSYMEVTTAGRRRRRRGSFAVHRATHRHRVCLPIDAHGHEIPCRTIVVTGPHRRRWGFWCGERFVPWREFGGCGEVA